MAWGDKERSYYFGNPLSEDWNLGDFRQRYFGDRPAQSIPTDGATAVVRRLCRTLLRLSEQTPNAAHMMRDGFKAIAVGPLHNGGRGLRISWPRSVWVACGSEIEQITGNFQPNAQSIYVGVRSENANGNLLGSGVAPQPLEFSLVTDEFLNGNEHLQVVGVDLAHELDHHRLMADAIEQRHPGLHCVVPADQLAANDRPPRGGEGVIVPDNRHIMELNTILYGPPGTGKTFATTALALSLIEPADEAAAKYAQVLLGAASDEEAPKIDKSDWQAWIGSFDDLRAKGRIEFTTFHQNYAYEDFIEGIRPDVNELGQVHYHVAPGVLKRIAYRALYAWITGEAAPVDEAGKKKVEERVSNWLLSEKTDRAEAVKSDKDAPRYLLIIDEINRGSVSRILGEMITLIEDSKRARRNPLPGQQPLQVTLPYSKEPFILPPNLYLLGTMNTADRSLVGLDLALRRRFSFEALEPKPELLGKCGDVDLNTFLTTLNKRIEEHLDRDHRIGHAFLMGPTDMGGLERAMRKKVIPQLMEYFPDRPDLLAKVLDGTSFVEFDNPSTPRRIKRIASEKLSVPGNYTAIAPAG